MHGNSDAVAVHAGSVSVGQTPNVIQTQELEDVLDTDTHLHIGILWIHQVGTRREGVQSFASILLQEGIVLV